MPDPVLAKASAEAGAGERSAAPRPKTATVERREASVPRHGTQGASQAPGTPRYGVPHGCLASTRTFLGAPPTPRLGVSEARVQTPGAHNAPRDRDGLFDIVSWAETRCCPHPEERACASAPAKSNARARLSKDEDERLRSPSCFETHRSAPSPWKRLCSLALRCSSA